MFHEPLDVWLTAIDPVIRELLLQQLPSADWSVPRTCPTCTPRNQSLNKPTTPKTSRKEHRHNWTPQCGPERMSGRLRKLCKVPVSVSQVNGVFISGVVCPSFPELEVYRGFPWLDMSPRRTCERPSHSKWSHHRLPRKKSSVTSAWDLGEA